MLINPEYKYGTNKLYSYQNDFYSHYFRFHAGLRFLKEILKKNRETKFH
jgi:hypothetical protein